MAAKNPILDDPAVVARFRELPPEARAALRAFLKWLYSHAAAEAEQAWRKKKAPMAVYWSSVKAWAFHLARVLR